MMGCYLLFELPLNLIDQLLTPTVDLILCIEQRSPALASLGLDRLDLLLPGKLFFQRERGISRFPCFPNLSVEFFDFSLQTHLQVFGPSIQLLGFYLEKFCVAP